MATDSETVDGVLMDDDNASYDKAAKRFLSRKMLLAWILKYLVVEFRDCPIKDIAEKYIEGDRGTQDRQEYQRFAQRGCECYGRHGNFRHHVPSHRTNDGRGHRPHHQH